MTAGDRKFERTSSFDDLLSEYLADPEFALEFVRADARLSLALQIQRAREARGLSQAQLAKLAGTSQAQVSRIENPGYRGVKLASVEKIAAALGATLQVRLDLGDENAAQESVTERAVTFEGPVPGVVRTTVASAQMYAEGLGILTAGVAGLLSPVQQMLEQMLDLLSPVSYGIGQAGMGSTVRPKSLPPTSHQYVAEANWPTDLDPATERCDNVDDAEGETDDSARSEGSWGASSQQHARVRLVA